MSHPIENSKLALRAAAVLALLMVSSLSAASSYQVRVFAKGVAAAPAVSASPPPQSFAQLTSMTVFPMAQLNDSGLTVQATAGAGGNTDPLAVSTICKSSGKWYWEVTETSVQGSYPILRVGYGAPNDATSKAYAEFYISTATVGATAFPSAVSAAGKSGVYGVALDAGSKTISVYWNGVLQGAGSYVDAGAACAYVGTQQFRDAGTAKATVNFGQSAFSYGPPAGYNPGLYN